MTIRKNRKGATSEVFKLALAVIVVAAILSLFAVFFQDVRESGQTSINATANALEVFSEKIANRTANF
jgi:uncharacterized protein (UPF0333 family)